MSTTFVIIAACLTIIPAIGTSRENMDSAINGFILLLILAITGAALSGFFNAIF